jgi:hypothetical protein
MLVAVSTEESVTGEIVAISKRVELPVVSRIAV